MAVVVVISAVYVRHGCVWLQCQSANLCACSCIQELVLGVQEHDDGLQLQA